MSESRRTLGAVSRAGRKAMHYLGSALFASIVMTGSSVWAAAESGSSFRLAIEGLSAETLQQGNISVMLDDYDVSHFATLHEGYIQVDLQTPLEAGSHQLAVLMFYFNGDIGTLAEKNLRLAPAASSQIQSELMANAFYRTGEKDKRDFQDSVRLMSEAALRVQSAHAKGNSSVNMHADVQYRSEDQTNLSGNEFELPNYLIDARQQTEVGELGFAVGHQDIGQQSLLFDAYNRRGISAGFSSNTGLSNAKVFMVSSEPTVSYRKSVVVPSDQEERSFGANFSASIFEENPDRLILGAGYIDGETKLLAVGIDYETGLVSETATAYGGDSWNVMMDSFWWARSLWFHSEYAESDFDADGFDVGEDAEQDEAYQVLLRVNSDGDLADSLSALGLQRWGLPLQHQTVGAKFFSIANLTLPGDLSTDRATMEFGRESWYLTSEWIETENNVDSRDDRPDQTIEQLRFNLDYSPLLDNPEGGLWGLIGQPSFNLQANQTQRGQPDEDGILAGYHLDDETWEYLFGVNFYLASLQWGIQYSLVDFDNSADDLIYQDFLVSEALNDSENQFATLSVNYAPTSYWSITPMLQWSDYQEDSISVSQDSLNLGFQSNWHILPELLVLDLSYSNNEQRTGYGGLFERERQISQLANATLTWYALTAEGNRPGLSFSLRGSWNDSDSHGQGFDAENYQVLLGVQLYWLAGE